MTYLASPVVAIEIGLVILLLGVIVVLGRHLSLSVGTVKAEIEPNGGSSLRDAVDRVEQSTQLLDTKFDIRMRAIEDRLLIIEVKDKKETS